MITILICILAGFIIVGAIATYFLLPLPGLSYAHSGLESDRGQVTAVKIFPNGVAEVGLTRGMEIDPRHLQKGVIRMVGATITVFVHFRHVMPLPEIGEVIEVSSVNRYHHFTGRSFNWVRTWTSVPNASITSGGKVTLVEEMPGMNSV